MNTLSNFRAFIKFLGKNKSYSFINVSGLAVSLMFVILITIYTVQELSTDRFHEKGDQVYVMNRENNMLFSYLLGEKLKSNIPEIQEVSPVNSIVINRMVYIEDRVEEVNFLVVAPTFFDFFSFPLLVGSKDNAFKDRSYAILSESFAKRAFPGKDPLGQTIRIDDNASVIVNGVMADIQNSAIHYGDILISHEAASQIDDCIMSEGCWGTSMYMMLPKQADVRAVEEKIKLFMNELQNVRPEEEELLRVFLIPLKEIYFSPLNPGSYWFCKGDRMLVVILLSIGFTILLFAVINYINLTVAQNGFRAKEMAVRSLLGSSRFELFSRMVTESTLICLISFLTGFLLLFTILPSANRLLQTTIDVKAFLSPVTIVLLMGFIALMGIITGVLPAIIISRTRPIEVVKGSFRKQTKMVFSKFFITFQNTITIILVAVSITMIWQTRYLVNAPLGFNKDNLLYIPTSGWSETNPELSKSLINELNQLACVKRATGAQGTPIEGGGNRGTQINGNRVRFQILKGNDDYFDMLGIQIIKENNLAGFGYYINEQGMQLAGIDENAHELKTDDGWHFPIAGIVKNFHMENISRGLDPVLLEKTVVAPEEVWQILAEVTGDHRHAYQQVKEVYERVTRLEFNGTFADETVQATFESQIRLSRLVSVFAFIAILISLLGLLAMSTYFIQQRSREVAVRKVFGSSSLQVLNRLVFTFLNYVFIAFVIATPVIWYLMRQWLSSYSYRITLSPLIFLAAGLFCLTISFVTVFWQSLEAANTNPAVSIKAE